MISIPLERPNEIIIDNILGPFTEFEMDKNGNAVNSKIWWEVNGIRMSDAEYQDWQNRKD